MARTGSMAKLVMISWVKREESWQWAEIQSLLMQDLVIASFFVYEADLYILMLDVS